MRAWARAALVGLMCVFGAPSVQAGGILAQELANPRGGTAQAGQAAYAGDAATAIYNPAGMSRLDEPQLLIGIQPICSAVTTT